MAKVEVVMPEMGESVMEGTVIEWSKQIGDKVEADDTLLEIATDKVDTEVPSPESGILVEILVEEGETVEVGRPIAVLETDPDAVGDEPSGQPEASEPAAEEVEESESEPEQVEAGGEPDSEKADSPDSGQPSAGSGQRIEVMMPQMGESVMEGTIIEWLKKPGDDVEVDDILLEIATDKVDTEVPSPESGKLVEILAESGETIEVGQVIAIIESGEAGAGEQAGAEAEAGQEEPSAPAVTNGAHRSEPVGATAEEPGSTGGDGRFYSPLVRSIAREEGISSQELEQIEGTGKEGRVSKEDILNYIEQKRRPKTPTARTQAPPQARQHEVTGGDEGQEPRERISAGELYVQRPTANTEIVKMDRMRKMIADHMVRSKQTSAHVTTFAEVDVTSVVRWREKNKKSFQEKAGVKLTYTPIFIEAIIQAIQEFPLINSSVNGDEIIVKKDINFGLAVALGEGGKGGLIVPVIKQAQDKNLIGLAKTVADMASKARNKNLKPDDLVDGTITLTNYGSVGNLMGTPIINQPQVAIMGTGVITKRPVVMETDQGDVIAVRHMMYLTMSYDHRIIDGAHGGTFLGRIKELLEQFDENRPV